MTLKTSTQKKHHLSIKDSCLDCALKVLHLHLSSFHVRLQFHGAIYRPNSFVLMLRYCANLKAIRYESSSLNRIIADKLHLVIVA